MTDSSPTDYALMDRPDCHRHALTCFFRLSGKCCHSDRRVGDDCPIERALPGLDARQAAAFTPLAN